MFEMWILLNTYSTVTNSSAINFLEENMLAKIK